MSDPLQDTLADRLRRLGAQPPAPALPAPEIRRRAERRRRRRHGLAGAAACAATALCLALPAVLHPSAPPQAPGPRRGAATADAPSGSASPRPSAAFTVTGTATAPIDAGTTAEILASCLGAEASKYHPVIAVRTPVASSNADGPDGVVVAVDSAHRYVQCGTRGRTGRSVSVPPTFINDRLWSPGRLVEFFDSFSAPAGPGRYLGVETGHYAPEVAKVTVSYGDDPTEYPAVMAGGAYVAAAAVSSGPLPPPCYVHAYDAHGTELYDQRTQPTTKEGSGGAGGR
ncbi:hypothetical protein ACIQBJ_06485 [Kitasatospora sp. NPDC088391]|uniref:hypothetical protein n=1 Tax=Kitasatospora sp. NPDC088391 TaxID=3364074 RepID=UPI0037F3E637